MVYAFGREEHHYSGTGTNQWNTYYYFLGNRLIGDLDANGTFYLLTDALGSILSDVSWSAGGASIKASQVFGPYGNARGSQGTFNTAKGFTGQYNDPLTGLDYYVSRYYDPVVGVFLSADKVQGNLPGMDPYTYVGGNPETKSDPTGQMIEGQNNEYGNIDSQGNLHIWVQYPSYGNGQGYLYHTYFYTREQLQQPDSQPPPSPQGDFWQQTLGFFDILLRKWLVESNIDTSCGFYMLSFTPSTKVATSEGERAIGSLHAGEKVWAYNSRTHKMEWEPIVHVWINHDDDLVDVTITSTLRSQHGKPAHATNEVIHTNKKHPFLTLEQGFVPVSQLGVGMHVVNAEGGIGTVTRLKTVPGIMTMYNLEVAQDHTYAVGKGNWIVHNCSVPMSSFDNRFAGMGGAPYSELITLIPAGARFLPFKGEGGMQGFKWVWNEIGPDGLSYRYELRMHSPDPRAIANYPDSNAAQGWTWRLQRSGGVDPTNPKSQGKGTWFMDAEGNWYKQGQMTEEEINATHIPMGTPTPEDIQMLEDLFGPPSSP